MASALHVPDRAHGAFVRFARGLDTAFETAHEAPLALPTAATLLIGREREIALLSHRLHDPRCRLITLSGPGGVGKTHLALHVAERHLPAMPDGACFVPLSALSSARDIPGALADALGMAPLDEAFRRLGHARDSGVVIEPRMFSALALYKASRYADAEREMTHMLSLALKMGSRWFEGIARHALAYGRFLDIGETERSFAEIMRAVTLLRGEDDVFAAMDVLLNASHIALAANRFDDADALLADCAETAFRLDNAYAMGGVELARGRLALARGDVKQARQHFEHSHELFQRVRAAPQANEVLALLARLRFNS